MTQPVPEPSDPTGTDTSTGADVTTGADGPTGAGATTGGDASIGAGAPDRSMRQAAIWATVVALPLTVLVALFAFGRLAPASEATANPTPSATSAAPRAQSTAPVPVTAEPLGDRAATVCRALLSRLPASLGELAQRPVTVGPEQNAAYGDPAVTVACGRPLPSFPPTDQVWVVNKVCWHAQQQTDATVFVTVDREVPVQVTVPRGYDPPLQWIAPVADPVVAAVPSAMTKPTGCTA
ncbi:DUF3515 domain-containing protein [Micromonospora sp. NBC_01699]|uniref:DUF3515 family protein n=1 Tax=Micromonospora sp. NBC_01699 TaxID=2975984 RepID=UPI002E354AAD|nr:DUF3515 family protein [Micromonospora sp. NBC_01699]